ncbi:MAG: SDR family oxidoreductase [Patescibacteria group bacterium]
MSKKVFVIGSTGLLGTEMMRRLPDLGYEVIGRSLEQDNLDVTNIESVAEYLDTFEPDIVINCAAITDVDGCESNMMYQRALAVNTKAPQNIVTECIKRELTCVHISTDYIFSDEDTQGHQEFDRSGRGANAYGESKRLSEEGIINLCGGLINSDFQLQDPKIYIVRISWLFGHNGVNFVQKITDLAKEKSELKVVDDEFGCPTYTKDVVEGVHHVLSTDMAAGIYHMCSPAVCSRYEFAEHILRRIDSPPQLLPAKMEEFPRPAHIPHYSILKNTKLPAFRNWQQMYDDFADSDTPILPNISA